MLTFHTPVKKGEKTHNINMHKFVIKHLDPHIHVCVRTHTHTRTHAPVHTHTHTHADLPEAGWRQLKVLGVRDREKVSLELGLIPLWMTSGGGGGGGSETKLTASIF